jgi:hypothetical protein
MAYAIPPWLESANPAAYSAKGYGLGIQAGAEQAANRFKQQQMALQEQKAAQDQAQMQAEMGLRQQAEQDKQQQFASDLALQQQHQDLLAQTAAQKSQAVLGYQQAIQGGMDPTEAILQFGPAMGQQASPEAAALRERNKQQAAWIPADLASGAPGHFTTPGGGVQIPPNIKPPPDKPTWVPKNDDTGEPAHWETASGQVHLPGKDSPDMSNAERSQTLTALRAERKELLDNNPGVLLKVGHKIPLTDAEKEVVSELDAIQQQEQELLPRLAKKANVPQGAPGAAAGTTWAKGPDGKYRPVGQASAAAPAQAPAAVPGAPYPLNGPAAAPGPAAPMPAPAQAPWPMGAPAAAPAMQAPIPAAAVPPPAAAAAAVPAALPPEAPGEVKLTPAHPQSNFDVKNIAAGNEVLAGKLNDNSLVDTATKLGIGARFLNGKFETWTGDDWTKSKKISRKKLEQMVADAASEQQMLLK